MAFDAQAESIFAKVFGRTPNTTEERSFLASASSRKQGGALQGALEFRQQQGGQGQQQGQQAASGQAQDKDPLSAAIESVEKAAKGVQTERQKLSTEQQRTQIEKKLLGNKGIQALIKMEGQLGGEVQEFDTGIEGNKVDRPTTQGALKLDQLNEIVRSLTETGRAVESRRGGILTGIESARQSEEERFSRAQAAQTSAQGALTSLIQGQQEQRAGALFPGQLQAQQQKLTGTTPPTPLELQQFGDPQAVLDFVDGRIAAGTANRPQRNNNPLNLKIGGLSQRFVDQGVASIESSPAQDGGNFLKFNTPTDGFNAAQTVLFGSPFYGSRTLDNAMRTWSGGGYGAEIASDFLKPNRRMSELSNVEQQRLIQKMAQREGFFAGAPKDLKDVFAPREGPDKIAQIIAETKAREIAKREVEKQFPKEADTQARNLADAGFNSLNNAKKLLLGSDDLSTFDDPDTSLKTNLLLRSRTPGAPFGRELKASLDNMLLNYIFMLSGKQVSEKEIGRFAKIGLLAGDSDKTIKFKLSQFQFMFDRVRGGGGTLDIGLDELANFNANDIKTLTDSFRGSGQEGGLTGTTSSGIGYRIEP